jgi:hypothetical protein
MNESEFINVGARNGLVVDDNLKHERKVLVVV